MIVVSLLHSMGLGVVIADWPFACEEGGNLGHRVLPLFAQGEVGQGPPGRDISCLALHSSSECGSRSSCHVINTTLGTMRTFLICF